MEQDEPNHTALLQRILEEQGYLVLRSHYPRKVGEVAPDFTVTLNGRRNLIDSPVVVIGHATAADFMAQWMRYHPYHKPARGDTEGFYFQKFIAE